MFRHTLKLALRNLLRSKVFTSINIIGLSIGMASSILILLLIKELVSVDQFHAKKDRIYVLYNRIKENGVIHAFAGSSSLIAPYIQSNYPQAEKVVRTHYIGNFIFNHGDKHLESVGILTDPGFLQTFTYPLVQGDPESALSGPRSVVLTETFARKLFGDHEAMGKTVRIDSNANFTVSGIVKDPPTHTMMTFDYLMPYSYRKEVGWEVLKWDDYSVMTYVLLKPGITQTAANDLVKNIIKNNAKDLNNELFLYPFKRLYLHGRFENGKESGGGIEFVNRIGLIGLFILLIACINYVNLSTARSILRAREVGIRKVVGARKVSLIKQFIGESILVAAIASLIGLGIAQLSVRFFNELVYTRFAIPYGNIWFWISGILFIIITGFICGIYPAFVLTAYQPVTVLKGIIRSARTVISPRKVLVVFQFSFAIVFIICTIVVYRQIRLGQNMDTGYDKNNLVYIYLRGDLPKHFDAARSELYQSGAITSVTRTNSPITMFWSHSDSYEWPGKNPDFKPGIPEYHSDNDFAKTMGVRVIRGRDINAVKFPTDSTAVLLNEAAVKLMGFENPVGQTIRNSKGDWHIVGVVKDFIAGNPYAPVEPLVIQGPKDWFGTLTFRLNPAHSTSSNLQKISAIVKKYNPDYPSNFIFVDDDYQQKFSGNKSLGKLALLFAAMAIIISCLGLYALAMYMANTRVKEIGIRKVLGASVLNITSLLSKDFVKLVLIAFLIASPVAWWILNSWLQDFTYRISISWWIFMLTALVSVLIALFTIGYQAMKAALANPVKNLRTE